METQLRYRLLALDADGTILDSRGILRPAVRDVIALVRAQGVRVVLCTGRRFRTAQPILLQLALSGPVIVQNGVAVKDGATGNTLRASYVPANAYGAALDVVSAFGPPAVYVDEGPHSDVDLVTSRGDEHHPFLSEYLEANRAQTRFVESLAAPPSDAVAMISAMAEHDALRAALQRLEAAPIAGIRANLIANKSYRGHILELVSADTGKWRRLLELAQSDGIDADEIVAIGDDANDREMIENAGLGIAMGNSIAVLREVADHVAPSNDDDGAAHAIRTFLL